MPNEPLHTTVAFRVTADEYDRLRRMAADGQMTLSRLIRQLVKEALHA